jgi:hypothetical protein
MSPVRLLPILRYAVCGLTLLALPWLTSCGRNEGTPSAPVSAVAPSEDPIAPTPVPAPEPSAPPKPFALDNYADLMLALQAQAKSGTPLTAEHAALTSEFFRGWGQKDGSAAVAFAQTVEESQITPSTLEVLGGWAVADLPAAVRWVTAYETDGHEKAFYLAKLATGLTDKQWEHLTPLAQAWSAIDPASANQWLIQLPPHATTRAAVEKSFKDWIAKDATSASEFLAAAPKGSARNAAIAALVLAIRAEDPTAAEKWQLELTPPPTNAQ